MNTPTPDIALLTMLASGPDSQIDPKMAAMIMAVLDGPISEAKAGLHKALDHGARYSWASSFVMKVLDIEWRRLGGTPEDPAPWRESMP